jgi:hypothetical protein
MSQHVALFTEPLNIQTVFFGIPEVMVCFGLLISACFARALRNLPYSQGVPDRLMGGVPIRVSLRVRGNESDPHRPGSFWVLFMPSPFQFLLPVPIIDFPSFHALRVPFSILPVLASRDLPLPLGIPSTPGSLSRVVAWFTRRLKTILAFLVASEHIHRKNLLACRAVFFRHPSRSPNILPHKDRVKIG